MWGGVGLTLVNPGSGSLKVTRACVCESSKHSILNCWRGFRVFWRKKGCGLSRTRDGSARFQGVGLTPAADHTCQTKKGQEGAGRLGDGLGKGDLTHADAVTSGRGDSEKVVGWDELHVASVDVGEGKALPRGDRLGDSADADWSPGKCRSVGKSKVG